MDLTLYTDGGSLNNPGKAASAYLIYLDGKLFTKDKKYIGIASNNVAEYTALIMALEKVLELLKKNEIHPKKITCISDSLLMVSQLNGVYKIKNETIKQLVQRVNGLKQQIALPITHTHVLREKNSEADALVKEVLA